jgi:hypothetical protein
MVFFGDLIKTWFVERFGSRLLSEEDHSYYMDWVKRFQGGRPETYMDLQSLRAWKKTVEEYLESLENDFP